MEHQRSPRASSSRSEFDFIDTLRRRATKRGATAGANPDSSSIIHPSSLICGVGDDAAVIRQVAGRNTVVTTDLLVEGIDFHRETIPPRLIGHKALAASLSDIAAMGARPHWALFSIGVPRDIWASDFLGQLYEGFFALADRYQVRLIGGDVSRTP